MDALCLRFVCRQTCFAATVNRAAVNAGVQASPRGPAFSSSGCKPADEVAGSHLLEEDPYSPRAVLRSRPVPRSRPPCTTPSASRCHTCPEPHSKPKRGVLICQMGSRLPQRPEAPPKDGVCRALLCSRGKGRPWAVGSQGRGPGFILSCVWGWVCVWALLEDGSRKPPGDEQTRTAPRTGTHTQARGCVFPEQGPRQAAPGGVQACSPGRPGGQQ